MLQSIPKSGSSVKFTNCTFILEDLGTQFKS